MYGVLFLYIKSQTTQTTQYETQIILNNKKKYNNYKGHVAVVRFKFIMYIILYKYKNREYIQRARKIG